MFPVFESSFPSRHRFDRRSMSTLVFKECTKPLVRFTPHSMQDECQSAHGVPWGTTDRNLPPTSDAQTGTNHRRCASGLLTQTTEAVDAILPPRVRAAPPAPILPPLPFDPARVSPRQAMAIPPSVGLAVSDSSAKDDTARSRRFEGTAAPGTYARHAARRLLRPMRS